MLDIIDLSTYQRWDIAGVDGLQIAKSWFGLEVQLIAPFQSLETAFEDNPCSVLRLCEGNFRISCPSTFKIVDAPQYHRVWAKRFDWLGAIAISDAALSCLETLATPKPPHRLSHLKPNCALPARIDGIAVLIWRHSLGNQPVIEMHTAQKDLYQLKMRLLNRIP
jgi:hypothetical protein